MLKICLTPPTLSETRCFNSCAGVRYLLSCGLSESQYDEGYTNRKGGAACFKQIGRIYCDDSPKAYIFESSEPIKTWPFETAGED
jgi:hypothetical protein